MSRSPGMPCIKCGLERESLHTRCKNCQKEYAKKNKEIISSYQKKYHLKRREGGAGLLKDTDGYLRRKYGITLVERDHMLMEQKWVCKLCGGDEPVEGRTLSVDHCHETGKVRGLLCQTCNRNVIGIIESKGIDPRKIVEYLA